MSLRCNVHSRITGQDEVEAQVCGLSLKLYPHSSISVSLSSVSWQDSILHQSRAHESSSQDLLPRNLNQDKSYVVVCIFWMRNLKDSDDREFAKCHTHLVKREFGIGICPSPDQNSYSFHHPRSPPRATWIICQSVVLTCHLSAENLEDLAIHHPHNP